MNQYLRALLNGLPPILQYLVALAIVMLLLYLCLLLSRAFGQNHGEKQRYDDPEAYEKSVPNVYGSTLFKRKSKKKAQDAHSDDSNPSD